MTKIFFVRHGEYINPKEVIPFRLPGFNLSDVGRTQIKEDAKFLKDKNIVALFASPILRTQQSAKILVEELNLDGFTTSKSIIEVKSDLAGITKSEYDRKLKDHDVYGDQMHIHPGGETIEGIYKRVKNLVDKAIKQYSNKNIIFVSHGDPIVIYTTYARGLTLNPAKRLKDQAKYIPKGGMVEVDYDSDGIPTKVQELNY